jgi:hypothetical protein
MSVFLWHAPGLLEERFRKVDAPQVKPLMQKLPARE